jgi:hypothetical protein
MTPVSEKPNADNPVMIALRHMPGLAQKLAEVCGVGRTAVAMWMDKGAVPPHHVIAVSRYLKLSPCVVRPDLYPAELFLPPSLPPIGAWSVNVYTDDIIISRIPFEQRPA